MALFTQTRHKGPGRFLQAKIWLFSIAAILMLIGMARENDILIGAAIALLAVAFVLRFFEKDEDDEPEDDDEDFADDDRDPAAELAPRDGEIRISPPTYPVEEPRRPAE